MARYDCDLLDGALSMDMIMIKILRVVAQRLAQMWVVLVARLTQSIPQAAERTSLEMNGSVLRTRIGD